MARHGGPGGHNRHVSPDGHGRIGEPRGHGMHSRPRGRMPHPVPIFGYSGMMGIGWLIAPFMGILFIMMLLSEISTNFTTILGLLCIAGAFTLLYQMRSKQKTKRKRNAYSDDYDSTNYDDEFYDERSVENHASS